MIVIATYNAPENLVRLLNSLATHWDSNAWTKDMPEDWEGDYCDVLVVGTAPGQEEIARRAFPKGQLLPFSIRFTETPWAGYDTGAYIWAYQNYEAASYLFLHDSMEVTGPEWLSQFHNKAVDAKAEVVPWCTFAPYLLGVLPHEGKCITETYGLFGEPGFGFFGPIFWATRGALDKISAAGYMKFVPSQKVHAQACERFWSLYCARLGITVEPVHHHGFGVLFNRGQHAHLSKFFLGRQ